MKLYTELFKKIIKRKHLLSNRYLVKLITIPDYYELDIKDNIYQLLDSNDIETANMAKEIIINQFKKQYSDSTAVELFNRFSGIGNKLYTYSYMDVRRGYLPSNNHMIYLTIKMNTVS